MEANDYSVTLDLGEFPFGVVYVCVHAHVLSQNIQVSEGVGRQEGELTCLH